MKKIYILLAVILIANLATAQKQVIKTSPFGYIYGKYNLQYERMLTDYSSVNVSASFLKPNLFGLEDVLNGLAYLGIDAEMSLNGAAFSADYRLYSQNKTGPRGFYIAPYLRYTGVGFFAKVEGDYSLVADDGTVTSINSIETGFSAKRYGFGLKLGAQWLIKDKVSIDWNFGGVGADLYKTVVSDEGTYYTEEDGLVGIQEDTVDFTWLYAFSTNFTIGFAF